MTNIDHSNQDDIADRAAAYALGALDPEEARALEEHLPTCEQCSEAVAEMKGVVTLLPFLVQTVDPPAHLKQETLDRIRSERAGQARSAAMSGSSRGAGPVSATRGLAAGRSSSRSGLGSLLMGRTVALVGSLAAVVLLVAMGVGLVQQRRQIAELRADLSEQQRVAALVAAPLARIQQLAQGDISGRMVAAPDLNTAYLVVDGLPPLPQDRDYQVWLLQNGRPVSVGVFHPDGKGRWLLQSTRPMRSYTWIGITQEPRGGSAAPTTKPLIGQDF